MTTIGKGKYKLARPIGKGSFGSVYADREFAIKEIKLPFDPRQHRHIITPSIANEIRILTQFDHPNVIKVYEVIEDPLAVYIVMELCETDLTSITDAGGCGQRKAVSIMRQIVRGLRELSRFGIVHRDLKPANILLNRGVAKLADFGMAKFIANQALLLRSQAGTPFYMAPQVLQNIDYSRKCDVWSLGMILYELVFGELPWRNENRKVFIDNIMSKPLAFPSQVSSAIKEILARMLAISQAHRASLDEIEKLLELYEEGEERKERAYHWTIVRKLMLHEADHISRLHFNRPFKALTQKEAREAEGEVGALLRGEESYLVQYLSLWREK